MVNVCGENIVVLGECSSDAKKSAISRYFRLHPEQLSQAVQLDAPCQWGGECPEGATNCAVCASIMADYASAKFFFHFGY